MGGGHGDMKMNDLLTETSLRAALNASGCPLPVHVLPVCDSTNAEARRLLLAGETGDALVTAEQQTAGRGRLGRHFHSPAGSGIYLSLMLALAKPLASSVSVTCAASVAVMRAIRQTTGRQVRIKWVNDLLLNGKKVCGILTEAVDFGEPTHLIVGVGINFRPAAFPPELPDAGSLNDEHTPRSVMIAAVVRELMPLLRHPDDHSWLNDYRAYSCVLGRTVRWSREGKTYEGRAESIDGEGGLTVRMQRGGTVVLRTGEISIRTLPEGED